MVNERRDIMQLPPSPSLSLPPTRNRFSRLVSREAQVFSPKTPPIEIRGNRQTGKSANRQTDKPANQQQQQQQLVVTSKFP
ncbi:hypothetical protein WN51_06828 [Melipona quadrifasciata]|uniref:Uncharacterized protein n=1 Tax=Melipona quadrifasciata TaxID=166423 RepID=A0A0N1IT46_9HYME|nr:hypothetical protein WN51_06828 [Melipona quadrifasciata]